jgi:hypothetical protein
MHRLTSGVEDKKALLILNAAATFKMATLELFMSFSVFLAVDRT